MAKEVIDLEREQFCYRYMVLCCHATIDGDNLFIQHGLRTYSFKLSQLTHLYIQFNKDFATLLLGRKGTHSQSVVQRIVANPGDRGFLAMVDAIAARRPDIDRRGLCEKEALRLIGARSHGYIAVAAILMLIPITVGVHLLPRLIHGLDFGEDRIPISRLTNGHQPVSRNVAITGAQAKRSDAVDIIATRGPEGGIVSSRTLIPLAEPEWDRTQPVYALLDIDSITTSEEAFLDKSATFKGVARNALWERLSHKEREYLEREGGLTLAHNVLLIDYRANQPHELFVALGWMAVSLVVASLMGIGIRMRTRTIPDHHKCAVTKLDDSSSLQNKAVQRNIYHDER